MGSGLYATLISICLSISLLPTSTHDLHSAEGATVNHSAAILCWGWGLNVWTHLGGGVNQLLP